APDEGFIIDSLGWLLYRQGRFEQALALLVQASRAAPGDPEILLHLGDVYAALGNRGGAGAAYKAALEARPPPMLRKRIEAKR
ncbi:MAG: tetratricopeptide repeat protein, partial [Deltaproteobacteria bacterium]|nr:tetratricopeptide repeat protein [Deltaproteobacteria bacterium]